jgi:hypothetical protein
MAKAEIPNFRLGISGVIPTRQNLPILLDINRITLPKKQRLGFSPRLNSSKTPAILRKILG